jgi:hypothetical protein
MGQSKPLSQQQSKEVQDAFKLQGIGGTPAWDEITGLNLYNQLAGRLNVRNPSPMSGSEAASDFLQKAGIPGIRYLDQGSRVGGKGTSNFVVFPGMEDILTIKERMKDGGPAHKWRGGALRRLAKYGKQYEPSKKTEIFIGEKSSTWNAGAASKARELEKIGVDPVDIWKQTGTFRSPDGSWRQEISDVGSKFRGKDEMKALADSMKQQEVDIKGAIAGSKLHPDLFPRQLTAAQRDLRQQAKDIKARRTMDGGPEYRVERGNRAEFALEHPELYKAYPNLSGMDVLQGGRSGYTRASYIEGIGGSDPGLMNVYNLGLQKNPRSSAVHEMQHAVQGIEDFGRGGNTAMAFQHKEAHKILNDLRKQALEPSPYEEYFKNAGLESLSPEDAMRRYEEYKKAIPRAAKQMDREFQSQAANLYYNRLAGEAEARAAQARIDLTPEQRLEKFPLEFGDHGYDVLPEDIIIKRRAKGGKVSIDAMRLAVGGSLFGEVAKRAAKAAQKGVQYTATDRARAGIDAAEMIERQEQVRASEALGQLMEKGIKKVSTTQSDRTRVGGGNIGGANFPAISLVDPEYAGKVWGVGDKPTAARLTNLSSPETAWTTMLGSANQLKTNPIVFDRMKRKFLTEMRAGNLSAELEKKIDKNLELTFGEGASIRDPKIWKEADTFDKRSALADIMMGQGIPPSKGGVSLGGEKSGRGVIFKPSEILTKETEPSLLHTEHGGDVPTYALGPRLFSLGKETYYRPDLHPGFPQLIEGKDFGFNVKPTPTEVFLPDWRERFKEKFPERKAPPGYYDLSLGLKGEGLPSQELNDEYIRHLIREGFKKGGPVKKAEGGLAPYGIRHSGEGAKGKGYFGLLPTASGDGHSTELSVESDRAGEHPLLVPTLTREEINYLLAGGKPTDSMYEKAERYALERKIVGKSPFAGPTELRRPLPPENQDSYSLYKKGGKVSMDAMRLAVGGKAISEARKAIKAFSEIGKKYRLSERSKEAAAKGELFIPDEEIGRIQRDILQQGTKGPKELAGGGQITSADLILEERQL